MNYGLLCLCLKNLAFNEGAHLGLYSIFLVCKFMGEGGTVGEYPEQRNEV